MVLRGDITKDKLKNIYDAINMIIENKDCYYSEDEFEKVKNSKKNILIKT